MPTVAEVMTTPATTIAPDATIEVAIRVMKQHLCRQLPVVVEEKVVGIVTDRDVRLAMNSPFILRERGEDEAILRNTLVRDCMTPDPLTISYDAPASLAADLLMTYKFGGIPVVSDGKLVGIITTSDILKNYIALLETSEDPLP